MRKWLTRILIALGGTILALFIATYFGGQWAVQKYLARELAVGDGKIHLVEPKFHWSLDLTAVSAAYQSPSLQATAGHTTVSVNLFRSLTQFSPSIALATDTLRVTLIPPPDTLKPKVDSVPFPNFQLPAQISIRIDRITVADSAGSLAACDGLRLKTRGPSSVRLSLRSISARALGPLVFSLQAYADWSGSTDLFGALSLQQQGDSLSAKVHLQKSNLLHGIGDLRMRAAASTPYARAFKLPSSTPLVESFLGEVHAEIHPSLRITLSATARVSGFPDTGSYRLHPQQTAVKLAFTDSTGRWSIASRGHGPEDVQLAGNLFVTQRDSLTDPAYLMQHLGVTAQGHIHGMTVMAAGKRMLANLEVSETRISHDAIVAEVTTGDGSRIMANLKHDKGVPTPTAKHLSSGLSAWQGDFSADLAPGEAWIKAFTDTNVAFRNLRVVGQISKGSITATSDADSIRAYGARADSLRLHHRYDSQGYTLEPSLWYRNGIAWTLSGQVNLAKPGKPMSIRMGNTEFGSAELSVPQPKTLQASLKNLAIEKIPYRGLDSLSINHPMVTADFSWDRKVDTGHVVANAQGIFKDQELQAIVESRWTHEILEVKKMQAKFATSEVEAGGVVRLRGRSFYDLGKVKIADIASVSVHSDRLDLAQALSLALPKPPLKSGSIVGDFSYSDATGFAGFYKFQNLQPQGDQIPATVKELALFGRGDTLVVKATTASDREVLFNDTLSISLTGALEKIQSVAIKVNSAGGLTADFQGNMHGYKDIEGRLAVDGKVTLPNKQGELLGLGLRAKLNLPFQQGLTGLQLNVDTLRGVYAVAGIDTQSFSATVKSRGDRITIPDLRVKGKGGEMQGVVDYAMTTRNLTATLRGQSLAAQLGNGNKVQIRDFRIDAMTDSGMFNLQVAIGSGSIEYVDAPMRAAADFSRIAGLYRVPFGKPKASQSRSSQVPFLRLSAVLDSSAVRYRLRSLESMQSLFKKSPARKRAKPMQVQINLETAGAGNTIETDILRVAYVGNVSMVGTYPYALMRGRLSSREGTLGTKKQAYRIRKLEVKWLNTPIEEGKLDMDSEKKLARTCEANVSDSCSVIMRLGGTLSNMRFSYDSDCQGSYGAGVQVSALVFSVRRGCYSAGFSGGGSGLTYEEQALTLLETPLSGYLSDAAEKLSGKWIASANVTGLGALAQDKNKKDSDTGSTAATSSNSRDAIALEILSKEFWRVRLRAKSAYKPDIAEDVNPWAYLVGLEWRPPLFRFIDNPLWKQRVKNNVNLDASVFTDPDHSQLGQNQLLRRIGLNYNYDFWGFWWSKPASEDSLRGKPRRRPAPIEDETP